jgi:capsid protein
MKFQPIRALRTMFGYDAINNKGRRNAVVVSSKSEDRELNSSDRKILTSNAEDQRRNVALCRWMINKHLDFVTKFSIQVRTGDQELNKEIERLIAWWSRPKNCDVAGRHSFQGMIRILESLAVVTGDAAISKLSSGKIQGIEGTRIATPSRGDIPEDLTKAKADGRLTNGIVHDGASRALKYVVNRRVRDGLEFEGVLNSQDVEFLGYFDRWDQIRGVSPIAAALNIMRDLYEGFEYALFKAKYHAFFGVAIYSDGSMEDDYFRQDEIRDKDTNDDDTIDETDAPRYEFQLKPGLKLELEKGDKVDTIESKTPSNEFQDYSVLMIQVALLALDIPLTFFDSRKSSFSASRSDMSLYMESVERKRAPLHEIIRNLIYWKLGQWTRTSGADGSPLLTLPDGMELRDVGIDIIATGVPWIDPMKEVAAGAKEIAIAVNSRQRYCRERGRDFWTILDELEAEEKALIDRGVTVEVATPGALTTRDEEGAGNPANTEDDGDVPTGAVEVE